MALRHVGVVDLPAHAAPGGLDHAAVHTASGRVYVAPTANDAVDVIDLPALKYAGSVGGLTQVAGALVTEAPDLVVTSNRGEDTIGVFAPSWESAVEKVGVGSRPNGLAYDARRGRLLVAHVGDAAIPASRTVSVVDVARRRLFCACDAGMLVELDADSGAIVAAEAIGGVPDVVFFNAALGRVYVAIGEPGIIEVVDVAPLRHRETVAAEAGAHALAFHPTRNVVCAFLPASHRAAVYTDS